VIFFPNVRIVLFTGRKSIFEFIPLPYWLAVWMQDHLSLPMERSIPLLAWTFTCSFGLSATSQQYFSLRTNQPPAINQQYFFLSEQISTSQTNRLFDWYWTLIKTSVIPTQKSGDTPTSIFGRSGSLWQKNIIHWFVWLICLKRKYDKRLKERNYSTKLHKHAGNGRTPAVSTGSRNRNGCRVPGRPRSNGTGSPDGRRAGTSSKPPGAGELASVFIQHPWDRIFFFFYILLSFFSKICGPQKNCKTIHLAPWGRRKGPTAVPHDGRAARGIVAPATTVGHCGRCLVFFQKIVIFCFNLDEGKLYMKIVVFMRSITL
jgi:hypothetical protein